MADEKKRVMPVSALEALKALKAATKEVDSGASVKSQGTCMIVGNELVFRAPIKGILPTIEHLKTRPNVYERADGSTRTTFTGNICLQAQTPAITFDVQDADGTVVAQARLLTQGMYNKMKSINLGFQLVALDDEAEEVPEAV